MNKTTKISVVTVCFNSIATIKKTIESVLSQTYDNYEHIFVDGGSTDGTIELIQSYEDRYNGRLILHVGKDKGIYDAMNKGIAISSGDIIGIINSDDWYDPTALQEVVRVYEQQKEKNVVITGDLVRTTIDEQFLYLQKHGENSISLAHLTEGMPLQHPAVFVAKKVYEELGCFDITYKYLADYDFIWRCFASKKVKFCFTGTTTSYMREGGASDTFKFKNIKDRTVERYRLRKIHIGKRKAFSTSARFFLTEIAKQSVKRILPNHLKDKYYGAKHGRENASVNQTAKTSKNIVQKINDFLRDYPRVRGAIILVIRYLQYFAATIKRHLKKAPDGFLTKGERLTPANENCYFGYYDKSPYSKDGEYLLYHSIPAMRAPRKKESAKLYIQSTKTGERTCLGKTLAWNLQQGSMLRFIDEHTVAWNDYRRGRYCAVFHDIASGQEHELDFPLYDVDSCNRYGLSLEFERLNVDAEGYGYIQEGQTEFHTPATISLIDIGQNTSRVIVSADKLNEKFPIPHKGVDFFYFNHLNFNPSGSRFLFIERYIYQHKRYSRLFSSDLTGNDIHLLADETMVSHFTWRTNDQIFVYCTHAGRDRYYLLDDKSNPELTAVENKKLMQDGHPTFLLHSIDAFVSDTYPDHGRRRHLFVYNIPHNAYKELAALKAPIKYDGPVRCDFHPRLHPDGKHVIIDSIHEGYRGLYEVEI